MTTGRAGAAAGLCFLVVWLLLYPAEPWDAGADVYDHLSVARNLLEGDGLSCDVIYPLTTTYEWGRQLPQPLLHRSPGFALLLTSALLAVDSDPKLARQAVRVLQIGLLALTVWLGLGGFFRRGAAFAGPAWLLLLLFNPLLGLAVNWGWVEVACAFLLLALWLRLRDRNPFAAGLRTALVDGALVGILTLLRIDLVWVPALWWLAAVLSTPHRRWFGWPRLRLYLAVSCGMWLLLTAPWWIHVSRVAGSPLFNPLSYALQLDLAENWWEYPRLRGLTPEPPLANLQANLLPTLLKVRHGIRFFLETLGHWLPWPVWGGVLVLAGASWRRRRRHGKLRAAGPTALLGLTLGGLILVYALLSQEVRHVLVLLPVLAWETVLLATQETRRLALRSRWRALLLAALAGLAILWAPPHLGGQAVRLAEIRRQEPSIAALAREVGSWPPGPVFTDNVAVCWLTGRTGVWRPYDEAVEAAIREVVPGMREARWVRLSAPD